MEGRWFRKPVCSGFDSHRRLHLPTAHNMGYYPSMAQRVKVLSVTRDDCVWTYSTHGGKGGQHANKNETAVKVVHPPSGAVGQARDSKSQWQNRQLAFRRMAESPEMQRWLRKQAGADAAREAEVKRVVTEQMRPQNIKVEVGDGINWREVQHDLQSLEQDLR